MKRISAFILAAWLAATQAGAGTITGKVHAEGKTGTDSDTDCGKYDSRAFKFVERVNYTEMRDFIVYIEGAVGTNKPVIPDKPVQVVTTKKVEQKKATFNPHVLPVVVGTTVEWPNQDEIYHNVFSDSEAKHFDLGLYLNPQVKSVTFDKSGRVDVFCSIHATMNCIVLVLENPYFASADARGQYSIAKVPPGTYKLKAWHQRMPSQVKDIVVPETGDVTVDFTLGINNLPKY